MKGITSGLITSFVGLIALQLTGVALLPRTQGFTSLGPTVGVLAIFAASYWIMARMIHSGANLGILIPLMATVTPLVTVAIGVLLYGESASALRLVLLTCACILVGAAARY